MKTKTITIGQYTLNEGDPLSFSVHEGIEPLCAVKRTYADAAEFARARYHLLRAPKRLTYWDGDTGTEALLDEVTR